MTLKIQIASDLHLEFYEKWQRIPDDLIVPKAPVLALLGDIGIGCTDQLKEFLYQQSDRFQTVLFIVGNHEFYNHNTHHSVEERFEWLRQVCSGRENLHLLEKTAMEIKGVRILGTALWSNIPPERETIAEERMNDYHLCFIRNPDSGMLRRLRAADTRQWHHESVKWLEDEIAAHRDKPVVVLTHHTPLTTGTSAPIYAKDPLGCCFSSDLKHLLKEPVRAWCCGHTHYNFDMMINNFTRLISNQAGYPGETKKAGYSNSRVLEIHTT